jgi:hypothetical protein
MRRWKTLIITIALAFPWLRLLATVRQIQDFPAIAAQIFGFWRGPVVQNNPTPTEFIVARWR